MNKFITVTKNDIAYFLGRKRTGEFRICQSWRTKIIYVVYKIEVGGLTEYSEIPLFKRNNPNLQIPRELIIGGYYVLEDGIVRRQIKQRFGTKTYWKMEETFGSVKASKRSLANFIRNHVRTNTENNIPGSTSSEKAENIMKLIADTYSK